MTASIGILGNGRMGKEIINLSKTDPRTRISSIKSRNDSFKDFFANINVVIDFSTPDSTKDLLEFVVKEKLQTGLVIGTTGLSSRHFDLMKNANCPIVYCENMSFFINQMAKLLSQIKCAPDTDIDIMDCHHKHKKDSPSGTSLLLKRYINNQNVKIHSTRRGGVFGIHSVYFTTENEELCISHTSFSRKQFAIGAIESACFVINKEKGIYDINDVING